MTTRASITVTTNRAPPARRHMPDRPPGGYHVTEPEPITSEPNRDYPAEIRQAIATLERLDRDLMQLDDQIIRYETALTGPDVDGWDRIDAEGKIAPLLERRNDLERAVMLAASTVSVNGSRLINGWKDNELDNIGKELIQCDGVLARVFAEFPETASHPVWQRLNAAAVPF